MTSRTSVRALISGRVQGVWYRGWTVAEATRRHLDGWVRNRADGTVEAVFAGPAAIVEDMLQACRRGPPSAQVTDIRTVATDDPGDIGFEQRDTA
jgi:acylphosphatase